MIFSCGIDRFTDLTVDDPRLAKAFAELLARNGFRVYHCRNDNGVMWVRFARGEPKPAATPGYQACCLAEMHTWNRHPCAGVYLYLIDPKWGSVRLASQKYAQPDMHIDTGWLPYEDDASDMAYDEEEGCYL